MMHNYVIEVRFHRTNKAYHTQIHSIYATAMKDAAAFSAYLSKSNLGPSTTTISKMKEN